MSEPVAAYRLPIRPDAVPGNIVFWDFQSLVDTRIPAAGGEPYDLQVGAGSVRSHAVAGSPFGSQALHLAEGAWLQIPRKACPRLDIHGPGRGMTLIAWIQRERTRDNHCEFIAGQWNETNKGRQYGLFLNIGVWGGAHQVCGHVSTCGGPTPGYKYCMDGAIGAQPVPWGPWQSVAMSFDGLTAYAWLNGRLDQREQVNPYHLGSALHGGGSNGSDFTVGGVDRSGEMGNFFSGNIGGLAVYDRALTPAEMWAVGAVRQ